MPIRMPAGLRRLSDKEFTQAAYTAMETIFAVHRQFGRLFDETVYTKEIARRLSNARVQVLLEVSFETFRKPYYLDLLYEDGAVFELKAAEALVDRFRAQLLNYLLLLELPHGKLVNLRAESVEHEFVNAPLTRAERTSFEVNTKCFKPTPKAAGYLCDLLVPMLHDWGTCLEVSLYAEAATHFLGGEAQVVQPVDVLWEGRKVGMQRFRLLSPETAFKITGFEAEHRGYEVELHRMLDHTALNFIQWINVGRRMVTFKTLSK